MPYFLTNVQHEKVLENGLQKKVTEQYVVDAINFTEAEARTIENLRPYISGEFQVTAVKTVKFSEIIPAEETQNENYSNYADIWYKVKINYLTLDEKTGEEKKTKAEFLIQASCLSEAIDRFNDYMIKSLSDYVFTAIIETPVTEVFIYKNQQ